MLLDTPTRASVRLAEELQLQEVQRYQCGVDEAQLERLFLASNVPSNSSDGNSKGNNESPDDDVVILLELSKHIHARRAKDSTNSATASSNGGTEPDAAAASFEAGTDKPSGVPMVSCITCFDDFPKTKVICAGAGDASSSTASFGCGHHLCSDCFGKHALEEVTGLRYPIRCPLARGAGQQQPVCLREFARDSVLEVLKAHPKEREGFENLEVLHTFDPSLRIHCPHKSCSALQLRPDPADVPEDGFTSCYHCNRAFCINCMIPGLHAGYTCAAFQALPPHQRSADDAAMLLLAEQQRWKACPQCKAMVEKNGGCNHMRCPAPCGADFCYACGALYRTTEPTPGHELKKPACACLLFDVPEEEADEDEDADDDEKEDDDEDDGDS